VKATDRIREAEKFMEASNRLFDSIKDGKLKSPEELAGAMIEKITNWTVSRLATLDETLKNPQFSQKHLNSLSKIKADKVLDAMMAIVEARGEVELLTTQKLNDYIESSADARLSFLRGNNLEKALWRAMFVMATKESSDVYALLRLSTNRLRVNQREFMRGLEELMHADTIEAVNGVTNKYKGRLDTQFSKLREARYNSVRTGYAVQANEQTRRVAGKIVESLGAKSNMLRTSLGEL
ncbi:uncharacterized protein METZ01_LOCUS492565, partial [marine metagenome]